MVKVSVIIPVYNVENYIQECIQSILNQTINEIEIIVIDDGSTDKSIDIIKKFNDERINIITNKKLGVSCARNEGIKIAKGRYISFVDSDDYIINNNAFKDMYEIGEIDKSDIIVGNAIEYYSEDRQNIIRRDKELFVRKKMNRDDFLIKFRKSHCMYVAVWMNMYRSDLLKGNNITFKEGFLHEDEDFTPKAFLSAKYISIYPNNFYAYRKREGSIMTTKNVKRAYDLIDICLDLQDELNNIENIELKK